MVWEGCHGELVTVTNSCPRRVKKREGRYEFLPNEGVHLPQGRGGQFSVGRERLYSRIVLSMSSTVLSLWDGTSTLPLPGSVILG